MMRLKRLEISGFKSFGRKNIIEFTSQISAIVGPNGSGKSNVAEALRFALGEQSTKALRGKRSEDLIFNGSEQSGRLNRAKVTIVFDNSDRALSIDFDEVAIGREVLRDGTNNYYINDSKVRLKDVIESLSDLHIGASSHHIISQGEADRILNASPKDRKIMVEDALGLKVYHWKISESEKKLEKTNDNMREIEILKRELTPQLRYLKKQVEKIDRAKQIRLQLSDLYKEYFKRESVYLKNTSGGLEEKKSQKENELREISEELRKKEDTLKLDAKDEELLERAKNAEMSLGELRGKKASLVREMGRIEGVLEYEERRRVFKKEPKVVEERQIGATSVKEFIDLIENAIVKAEAEKGVEKMKIILLDLRQKTKNFLLKISHVEENDEPDTSIEDEKESIRKHLEELRHKKEALETDEKKVLEEEKYLLDEQQSITSEMNSRKELTRDAERALFELKTKHNKISSEVNMLLSQERQSREENEFFKQEIESALEFVGQEIRQYEQLEISDEDILGEERSVQRTRYREVERLKIRLEDMGVQNATELIAEFKDTETRALFLEREFDDLTNSAIALRELIDDLSARLEDEFEVGIIKINEQFQNFFALMFGGGRATLRVVLNKKRRRKSPESVDVDVTNPPPEDEPEETEKGLDIEVVLPRKKIKGLMMLSGGERALTSIALLFAISQVNPPPFMLLDETDAALDEANSRRYGDMLKNLSEYSQLLVITHNRETMSKAGVLYGITMGSDAISKLLSVNFEEAVKVAK